MNKFLPLLALALSTLSVNAQQPATPMDQLYGKIDQADLEMKACDFEKDANSEILIDKADLYYDQSFNIVMDYHERIKIFNEKGKDAADIRIPYFNYDHAEYVTGLQAETINIVDGKQQITRLDKKQVFTQAINKYKSMLVFTMPDVKPGSIIEYKYTWTNSANWGIPSWYFQSTERPVRYSELCTHIPEYFYYSKNTHTVFPLTINTTKQESGNIGSGQDAVTFSIEAHKMAMVNVPSLPSELYMRSSNDNLESMTFHLTTFKPPYGFVHNISDTWAKVGDGLADHEDFGKQIRRKLTNEDAIINAAKALKTDDEKIAYVFNTVKNSMKWNGDDYVYTVDGTSEAWEKKTGNSTEINLILYHLLKKSGVAALPMVVSTRDNGRVNISYTSAAQFNRAVVYIPVDSARRYVLDATGKYNLYNEIPYELLNSYGLFLNMDAKNYDLVFLNKQLPVRRSVYISAEIKADGKLDGVAQLSCAGYNRIDGITKYKTDGEKKYIDYLRDNDNNLKISAIKMVNMDVDTVPLEEQINFNLDLANSDDNYIYFTPNLFTSLRVNPFLSENRHTDIDFGYLDDVALNGSFKIPAGYKVDALPKNISLSMPDKSIVFRRIEGEQDGVIAVRYMITYNKSIYFKEDYADFHEFYKKMYEMLNEQIVLKKS